MGRKGDRDGRFASRLDSLAAALYSPEVANITHLLANFALLHLTESSLLLPFRIFLSCSFAVLLVLQPSLLLLPPRVPCYQIDHIDL